MAKNIKGWLLIGLVGLVLLTFYKLLPILSPFLVSILLAYMGDPLVDILERYKISRTWGVVLVFILLSLILLVLLLVLIPMIGRQLVSLYELTPQLIDWVQNTAVPWMQTKLGINASASSLSNIKQMFSENLGKTTDIAQLLLSQVTASSLAFLGWLANMLLIPVVTFYLLRDWDILVAKMRRLLPRQKEGTIVRLIGECHEVLGAFMRGQLLVMLALGVVYAIGLMALGLELGLIIGILAGLASLVPYMGFAVGISAALIAGLFQFGLDPYPLLGIIAVFTAGQMLVHLDVKGDNLQWYADAQKQQSLPLSTPLVDSTTYYVTQQMANRCESDVLGILVTEELGVSNVRLEELKLYPNPVRNVLQVSCGVRINKVVLYDLSGRQLAVQMLGQSASGREMQLDFSGYEAATYFLKIITDQGMETVQVVKK